MKVKSNILIVGRGNLAQAIKKQCVDERLSYALWETGKSYTKSVVLYCGSQRLFKEVSDFCTATKSPLILLSTDVRPINNPTYRFVFVPNTSKEVREFIQAVTEFAVKTEYSKVAIVESHQSTKKDVSGTAQLLAKNLGKSRKIITSIRSPKEQIKLGIPRKHLNGHAYHHITFTHEDLTTIFSVLVLGRKTYAKGALEIARSFDEHTKANTFLWATEN